MSLGPQILLVAFACIVPFYRHAFFRLFGIVKSERPEWLQVRSSMRQVYEGALRIGDPNVQVELLKIAFGARSRELQSPMATSYARRIRFLGCTGFILFLAGLTWLLASAP